MPEDADKGAPRGMWTGTITFGLVSVPVSLFPALRGRPTHLRMLSDTGAPLRRQYVCSKDGKALGADDLIRGYETEDGKMLAVADEELEALAPGKTRDISLKDFVRMEEIPVLHFDRPYFLVPSGGSTKAYRLLARVMEDHQRAGIGSFVMREKEYLIAILAKGGLLMAETLRFSDEIRTPAEVGLPQVKEAPRDALKAFQASIKALSRKNLDRGELKDIYAEDLEKLIARKRRSPKAVVQVKTEPEEEDEEPGNTIDLVAIFKERMREAQAAEGARGQASGEGADLDHLTKEELYERAKARNIPGRSKMTKEELIGALSEERAA